MLFRQEMELEELRVSSDSALKELQQLQVNQHHVFCGILVSTSKGMHAEFIPLPREIMVCFSVWCPMRVNETLQSWQNHNRRFPTNEKKKTLVDGKRSSR